MEFHNSTPLCPVGHLPLKGGYPQEAISASLSSLVRTAHLKGFGMFELQDAHDRAPIQSPPLRGRCPTGQRGVFGTVKGVLGAAEGHFA
jgi:hypothetical protein